MRSLIVLIVGLVSVQAVAQSSNDFYRLFPVLECPAVGDEYEKMLSKLESIKVAIKEGANCENIELQVKSLQDLVVRDRQEVVAIAEKSQGQAPGTGQSLSEADAAKVRLYAENVTKKVAALNDLFMNNNQCFKEDVADKQLTTLAGFVSEASQLVGTLSGPWGAPIALAGHVVAGFLTGLDHVLKSRAGFDFSKREQWTSYVQNLCTYHSYRDQIDHLLNPQAKISQLKELKDNLDSQIRAMTNRCAECQAIEKVFNSQTTRPTEELKVMLNSEVTSADQRFAKPYGTYTLQSLGLRDWVNREMSRIEKEAQSYWGDVSGRHLLYRAKEAIEQFLLQREAPRFLAFQARQSRNDFSQFQSFQLDEGRSLYFQMERMDPKIIQQKIQFVGWSDPFDIFKALVISPLNFTSLPKTDEGEDVKFSWTHFRDQSLMRLRTAQTSTQVVQSFCGFFKHSGQYSSAIRSECSADQFKRLVHDQNQIEQELTTAKIPINPRPVMINPELQGNAIYSLNKLEALNKAIQNREL